MKSEIGALDCQVMAAYLKCIGYSIFLYTCILTSLDVLYLQVNPFKNVDFTRCKSAAVQDDVTIGR